jgi:prephenate dehydratase
LILPIHHLLFSRASSFNELKTIYSHPQALAQCQRWLDEYVSNASLIPTNSTAEALQHPDKEITAAAIASPRAAELYDIPVLAKNINDYPDNCTRFWIVGLNGASEGTRLSLAFTVPQNVPGALVNPLQVFAKRNLNLSRIESRPTKRSLGEYLFFLDLAGNLQDISVQEGLKELEQYTETIKIFGSYDLLRD